MATQPTPLALRLAGEDHALEPGREYTLGSGPDCDFRLPPPAATLHARIAIGEFSATLTDLGSDAGTWRNGERIVSADLAIGDVLRFGTVGASEAIVVPDHGHAVLVPLPAMRAAATTRKLRRIGERAAQVVRQRDAETFQEMMAHELRRAPWFATSLALHALLLLLLWAMLPDGSRGARMAAKVSIHLDAGAVSGEGVPDAPQVASEPQTPPFALAAEPPKDADVAGTVAKAEPEPREPMSLRSNPRLATGGGAAPAASEPGATEVRTIGSGGFRQTVAELQKSGLEIVFVFDSTGSMTGTIADTKASIAQMLAVLKALVPDARVGIVTYRDRGREFYRVRELPLGVDFFATSNFVQLVSAEGGGDRPEDVRAGLEAAFAQRWRPEARRVVVLAGDAPPHEKDEKLLLRAVGAFAKNGRSFVHTLVTSPESAGADTHRSFEAIARAGNGTCAPLQSRDRVMQRVLSLAFGREFDQDLVAVTESVETASARVDVRALDLARRGGADLARELRRNPVPTSLVNALVRRPRQDTALELVAMLRDPEVPAHTLQAVAWVLQRVLELSAPPADPFTAERPSGAVLEHLRRLCLSLPR